MKIFLGLWAVSHLFLSSSSHSCANQQPWANVPEEEAHGPDSPWLVSIIGNGRSCKGAVLNNWWILTAASCFLLMKPSYVELTRTGGHFSTMTVSQFLSHRGFSSWARPPNSDLGLVMLGEPIDLRSRDMWPVCLPDEEEPSLELEHCRIYEQGPYGSKQLLEMMSVSLLDISNCTKEWPGTSEKWNMCIARKELDEIGCEVPIGSPVLCRDVATDHWELRGIVTQSLSDCASPVLASQVVPHLEWLRQEGIMNYPSQEMLEPTEPSGNSTYFPTTEQSSTAGVQFHDAFQAQEELAEQQAVTSPTEQPLEPATTSGLFSPTDLHVPVKIPFAKQEFEEPPTTEKINPSPPKVTTYPTTRSSVPVKSSTEKPSSPSTHHHLIFETYPSIKRSSTVTSTMTASPVSPTRGTSRPQTTTPGTGRVIIIGGATPRKSPRTGWLFTPASSKTHFTTNKRTYGAPSEKNLSYKTTKLPLETSSTTRQSPTEIRLVSPAASPINRQPPLTTTSHSSLAIVTVAHSRHIIIIPVTPRPVLTSPVTTKGPPAEPPSPKPPAERSGP